MLLKILKEHEPDYIAVVFDAPGPTFRHELYPEYKANRPPMPDDLKLQIPRIDDVVKAFRIPVVRREGVEADDIIATLAERFRNDVDRVVIVSSDKDFMQLVADKVIMLDTMKDRWIGKDEVHERFSVDPPRVPDVLALMGDSSDNIPGLPGVGPKTAGKLIARFGSLENLLAHSDEVDGKIGESIPDAAEGLRTGLSLVTLHRDVDVEGEMDHFKISEPDTDALRSLFEEFQFNRLISDLTPRQALARDDYRTVLTDPELRELCEILEDSDIFALDTETDGIDPMRADLVGISFSWAEGQAAYLPLGHSYLGVQQQIPHSKALKALEPVFSNRNIGKIGQNIKFDYKVLRQAGWPLEGITCDTMVASWLEDPSRRSHGLSEIASDRLGHTMIEYKEVAGSGKKQIPFSLVPIETASTYSCEDADVTFRLAEPLLRDLGSLGLSGLYHDVEIPLVGILAGMEMTGILLDTQLLSSLSVELKADLQAIESRIHSEAGKEFNINSPKQLAQVLFTDLGLPPVKKTKTGFSTNDDVLMELSEKHQLPSMVREYRSLAKLKSTYLDALPALVHPDTGRIHTSFNQAATATGRLSSSNPNLQNIPVRTDLGKRIREAFIAPEGKTLLSADYSQIELRVLAHLSGDSSLLEAFQQGEDIHDRTARQVFSTRAESAGTEGAEPVEPELRRRAKVINFGIIYGMSAYGLSKELGIHPGEASGMIEDYFNVYSGVKEYIDNCLLKAREDGFVTTMMGRRRNLSELGSSNPNVRQMGERMAVNTPIQGTAADLIKMAMINVQEILDRELPDTRMLLQVHDELVFEVPENDVERAKVMISESMMSVAELDVPLIVDVGVGRNWALAH